MQEIKEFSHTYDGKERIKKTMRELMLEYLQEKKDCVATLKELYQAVRNGWDKESPTLNDSVRCLVYRHPEQFKRVGKGLYLLVGQKGTSSLIIHGDGRSLSELDDESCDTIITDHPWQDKKAHQSGNQGSFAAYKTFMYEQADFDAKYRVLKDGCFLAEFLPVESETNTEYLQNVRQMAKKAGFNFYAYVIYRKAKEGTINTGRTTKGVESIIIFSKGKPRRIAPTGKPYMTRNILSFEIDIPASKGKNKFHQAEKPIELYEYLIENLTEEKEVCLDSFSGSCNLAQAAVNKSRFGIVYEYSKEFVRKAVERFGCITFFEGMKEPEQKEVAISEESKAQEVISICMIPEEITEFQIKYLTKVLQNRPELMTLRQKDQFHDILKASKNKMLNIVDATIINEIFNDVNYKGYTNYNRPIFEPVSEGAPVLKKVYEEIENDFFVKFPDEHLRSYYLNYKIEMESYADFLVYKHGIQSYCELSKLSNINLYLDYLKTYYGQLNYSRTEKLIFGFTNQSSNAA